MTEDQLLFASVLANPAEDAPRLVLADWFDEHDEPALAAALRASKEMVTFLGELLRWDISPALPVRTVADVKFCDLWPTLPGAQLLTRYRDLFPVSPNSPTEFRVGVEPPRRSDDPLDPTSFLVRWQHERRRQIAALRAFASGSANRPATQQRAFEEDPDTRTFEKQSCRLHELVLRGRELSAIPGALAHADRMRERGHPLAWLPLALLAPDAWHAPHPRDPLPVRALGATVPAVIGSEALAAESPVFAAVRGWAEESNGALEGHVFRLDRPLNPDAVGRLWFTRLPADSLNAALVTANWSVNRAAAGTALADLFRAAHGGGAYARREWGAYARLHAWQSIGALAGCASGASANDVAAEVERCEWFTFGGTSWFAQIAWDLGLICLRSDRHTVALLAATDGD